MTTRSCKIERECDCCCCVVDESLVNRFVMITWIARRRWRLRHNNNINSRTMSLTNVYGDDPNILGRIENESSVLTESLSGLVAAAVREEENSLFRSSIGIKLNVIVFIIVFVLWDCTRLFAVMSWNRVAFQPWCHWRAQNDIID